MICFVIIFAEPLFYILLFPDYKQKTGVFMAILRKKQPSEKEIEDSILYWLNYQPRCYGFKLNLKGTWDPRLKCFRKLPRWVPLGGSDIIAVIHGRMAALEVKTPATYRAFFKSPGEHELRQEAFLQLIRAKGGIGEVVCSIDQVEAIVNRAKTLNWGP